MFEERAEEVVKTNDDEGAGERHLSQGDNKEPGQDIASVSAKMPQAVTEEDVLPANMTLLVKRNDRNELIDKLMHSFASAMDESEVCSGCPVAVATIRTIEMEKISGNSCFGIGFACLLCSNGLKINAKAVLEPINVDDVNIYYNAETAKREDHVRAIEQAKKRIDEIMSQVKAEKVSKNVNLMQHLKHLFSCQNLNELMKVDVKQVGVGAYFWVENDNSVYAKTDAGHFEFIGFATKESVVELRKQQQLIKTGDA
jgi:hypothetical protein